MPSSKHFSSIKSSTPPFSTYALSPFLHLQSSIPYLNPSPAAYARSNRRRCAPGTHPHTSPARPRAGPSPLAVRPSATHVCRAAPSGRCGPPSKHVPAPAADAASTPGRGWILPGRAPTPATGRTAASWHDAHASACDAATSRSVRARPARHPGVRPGAEGELGSFYPFVLVVDGFIPTVVCMQCGKLTRLVVCRICLCKC